MITAKDFYDTLKKVRENKKYVPDGVYDISDIEFLEPENIWRNSTEKQIKEAYDKLINFAEKYPNFVIAEPYQTEYSIFLSEMPTKSIEYIGSGFNHGSNNIIDNCPKRILICGEDD